MTFITIIPFQIYRFNFAFILKANTKKVNIKLQYFSTKSKPSAAIAKGSFPRNFKYKYLEINKAVGIFFHLTDGRRIIDASGGAAVSIIGHGNIRVKKAIMKQMATGHTYSTPAIFKSSIANQLCLALVRSIDGKMSHVLLMSSGSEATEVCIKLALAYFKEKFINGRINIIARHQSYHGNLFGSLSLSGMPSRKNPYMSSLMPNVHHVSSCNFYRQGLENQSQAEFVSTKVKELESEFQELGPDTVAAVILEPIVGAALGCVTAVAGYLEAIRDVCHKHGALLIFDEVMCGMGRTGHLHAWQIENVVPDIQAVAKGLGGGYVPIAAVLVSEKVTNAFIDGSGQFIHGQTYQGMPHISAGSLEVLKIITENDNKLLKKGLKMSEYLFRNLKIKLSNHPNVGDIRGTGLFCGIEFVENKLTKKPFDRKLNISKNIADFALETPYQIAVYPGSGTADGYNGDHHIIAPPLTVKKKEILLIVDRYSSAVIDYFNKNKV